MKNFIRLTDFTQKEILEIMNLADCVRDGKYKTVLRGKTIVLFFPQSSIRTRVTFEKGIWELGGQPILFPPETLDKKEKLEDVIGYLTNWADAVVIRHKDISILEELARTSTIPILNAMTDSNHPCEVLTDLYALSKRREDYLMANYLFVGGAGNIGYAWREAAKALSLSLTQCCPSGYEMNFVPVIQDLKEAMTGRDIILTDSLTKEMLQDFKKYQVTEELLQVTNQGALLNPCPPFYRGEEVSTDAIRSPYFVGYEFKKSLLEVQQAILIYTMQ